MSIFRSSPDERAASAQVKGFQIHNGGRNAADNVGSIFDPSNIDALPTTRLFTAWFQQNFLGDAVSIRAGQLAADDEFLTSPTAGGLINGTFGWAAINAANIKSGGPAYPLATPGMRLQVEAVIRCHAARRGVFRRPGGQELHGQSTRSATATARPSASRAARCGSPRRSLQ